MWSSGSAPKIPLYELHANIFPVTSQLHPSVCSFCCLHLRAHANTIERLSVIVAVDGGIPAFGDFINAVILLAVVSIGLSGVFGGSRTLTALAEQGYAPKIFGYIDRAGRPLYSVLAILAFGPLAYLGLASSGQTVFAWLLSLSGLAALFTWGSICLAHIRFRQAWKYHGHTDDELPFRSPFGVWGSWIGLGLNVLVLIATVCLHLSSYS